MGASGLTVGRQQSFRIHREADGQGYVRIRKGRKKEGY
jgi:hypothetical protein